MALQTYPLNQGMLCYYQLKYQMGHSLLHSYVPTQSEVKSDSSFALVTSPSIFIFALKQLLEPGFA